MRTGFRYRIAALSLLAVGLAGCRHKQPAQAPVLVQTNAPEIPLVQPPASDSLPMVQATEVKEPSPPAVTPKTRRRRPVAKKAAAVDAATKTGGPAGGATGPGAGGVAVTVGAPTGVAPLQVAGVGAAPEVSAIGALTTGGDSNPKTQQEAEDVIGTVRKRMDGLGQSVKDAQKVSLEKIRRFLMQAEAALKSGDAQGAKTLATKASVLLDDLMK